ncbi:MAG: pinensin family lanthipeptide [Saprospiraceae bacterium]|nr:pinensin family lanthipeptide [Saprospiraceae bacterium]
MAKKKLKLNELKVQSIVTSLEEGQMQTLKGGKEVVGRRRSYTVRWTMIDTRVQTDSVNAPIGGN